jgi:hypothetical protein
MYPGRGAWDTERRGPAACGQRGPRAGLRQRRQVHLGEDGGSPSVATSCSRVFPRTGSISLVDGLFEQRERRLVATDLNAITMPGLLVAVLSNGDKSLVRFD